MPYNFDERCYECGFWPGDLNFPQPAFYAMTYPFIIDLQGNEKYLRPERAFYKPEKMVFYFTQKDILNYKNKEKMVVDFLHYGLKNMIEILKKKKKK